jgi:hypothetical protein
VSTTWVSSFEQKGQRMGLRVARGPPYRA